MKKKKSRFLLGFFLGMIAMLVTIGGIWAGLYFSQNEKKETKVSDSVEQKVDYLEKMIDAYYLDETDQEQMEEGIYKGLISGLNDPYSAYYTEEEYKALMEDTLGTYYGIGALVSQDVNTGIITVIKAFENAPAEKAGMENGDVIYKVEGEEVSGEDLNNVVAKMKGDKGTVVNITVYRESENKYIELKVTRDEVNVPTVEYKMLNKKQGIGYIQISQFEEVTYEQFEEAITALKKQGVKGIIFDVRDNPGGLYDVVCKILDDLLPEGTLVYTKDKYGTKEEQTSDENCLGMPIVVVQNENSASASEIFAGAIQDFEAGKVVGTQSFGKGIVQSIFPLSDGTAVKLTISKYYTPKGTNIHGKGITPDVEVEAGTSEDKDEQLIKAQEIIKGLMK